MISSSDREVCLFLPRHRVPVPLKKRHLETSRLPWLTAVPRPRGHLFPAAHFLGDSPFPSALPRPQRPVERPTEASLEPPASCYFFKDQ